VAHRTQPWYANSKNRPAGVWSIDNGVPPLLTYAKPKFDPTNATALQGVCAADFVVAKFMKDVIDLLTNVSPAGEVRRASVSPSSSLSVVSPVFVALPAERRMLIASPHRRRCASQRWMARR
jgi:hypothetical protein